MGMDIDLSALNLRADKALFSESTGRILVTVAPQNKEKFLKNFKGYEHIYEIGFIAKTEKLNVKNTLDIEVSKLDEAYKATLKDY